MRMSNGPGSMRRNTKETHKRAKTIKADNTREHIYAASYESRQDENRVMKRKGKIGLEGSGCRAWEGDRARKYHTAINLTGR